MRRFTPFFYKILSIPSYQYQVTRSLLVPLHTAFLSTNHVMMTQASMNIFSSLFYQIKPRLRIHYHYRLQIHTFIVIVTLMLFATAFEKRIVEARKFSINKCATFKLHKIFVKEAFSCNFL